MPKAAQQNFIEGIKEEKKRERGEPEQKNQSAQARQANSTCLIDNKFYTSKSYFTNFFC